MAAIEQFEPFRYTDEPLGIWSEPDFEKFMLWAVSVEGISDIFITSNDKIGVRYYGRWLRASKYPLSRDSLVNILKFSSNDDSSLSIISSGKDIDYSYNIKLSREISRRFRVNATGCVDKSGSFSGITIVFRILPSRIPSIEELGVEESIILASQPNNGIVFATGTMGTGKSTLLAAILGEIIIKQNKNVVTVEDPVEFDLLSIPNAESFVVQSEIKRHFKSFSDVPRNVARRAVDVCYIGEARDRETLEGMLHAAEMGMAVYSTVHTKSVSETFSRIVKVFPDEQQNSILAQLINQTRLIIQQRLLSSIDGKRVAIREYLELQQKHRTVLLNTPVTKIKQVMHEFVLQDGVSLEQSARKRFDEGTISETIYNVIKREQL